MTPELSDLLRQLDAIKADAHALCAGLTATQFNWRPGEGRWSIAECIVHLTVSTNQSLPAFDRSIAEGRAKERTAPGPFRYGWLSRWMVADMEPPPKRRYKTFRIFEVPPHATHALATALPQFVTAVDQLAERVRRADGLDLKRNKTVSPASKLVRLPLGAYFQFVVAHFRRHLWQGRQVRSAPGFGAA